MSKTLTPGGGRVSPPPPVPEWHPEATPPAPPKARTTVSVLIAALLAIGAAAVSGTAAFLIADDTNQAHDLQAQLTETEDDLSSTEAKLADARDELSVAQDELAQADQRVADARQQGYDEGYSEGLAAADASMFGTTSDQQLTDYWWQTQSGSVLENLIEQEMTARGLSIPEV